MTSELGVAACELPAVLPAQYRLVLVLHGGELQEPIQLIRQFRGSHRLFRQGRGVRVLVCRARRVGRDGVVWGDPG
jgi:hypothetical protein